MISSATSRHRLLAAVLAALTVLSALNVITTPAWADDEPGATVTPAGSVDVVLTGRFDGEHRTDIVAGVVSPEHFSDDLDPGANLPLAFEFNVACGDSGCETGTTVEWDFGDGSDTPPGDFTTFHAYTEPGVYTVVARVVDAGNNTNSQATIEVLVAPRYADVAPDGGPSNPGRADREAIWATMALGLLNPCRVAVPFSGSAIDATTTEANRALFCGEPDATYVPTPTVAPQLPAGATANAVTGVACADAWWVCGLPRAIFTRDGATSPQASCGTDCNTDLRRFSFIEGDSRLMYQSDACEDNWVMRRSGGQWVPDVGVEAGCVSRGEFYTALVRAVDGSVATKSIPGALMADASVCVDGAGTGEAANSLRRAAALLGNDVVLRNRVGDLWCDTGAAITKREAYAAIAAVTGAPDAAGVGIRDLDDIHLGRNGAPTPDPDASTLGSITAVSGPLVGDLDCADRVGVCFNADEALTRSMLAVLIADLVIGPGRLSGGLTVDLIADNTPRYVNDQVRLRAVVDVPRYYTTGETVSITWPTSSPAASFACGPTTAAVGETRSVTFECVLTRATTGSGAVSVTVADQRGNTRQATLTVNYRNSSPRIIRDTLWGAPDVGTFLIVSTGELTAADQMVRASIEAAGYLAVVVDDIGDFAAIDQATVAGAVATPSVAGTPAATLLRNAPYPVIAYDGDTYAALNMSPSNTTTGWADTVAFGDPYGSLVLADNPAAYLRFGDQAPGGNPLTNLAGGPGATAASGDMSFDATGAVASGGSLRLTGGADSYVSLGNVAGIGATNVTLECWVFIDGPVSGPCAYLAGSDGGIGLGVGDNTYDNNGLRPVVLFAGRRWVNATDTLNVGWNHLAVSIDASGQPSIFVNGRRGVVPNQIGVAPTLGTGVTLHVGRSLGNESGVPRTLETAVDEVAVYPAALDVAGVSKRYTAAVASRGAERLIGGIAAGATTITDSPARYTAATPAGAAAVWATVFSSAVLFTYEGGTELADGSVAPSCRTGVPVPDTGVWNAAGRDMFAAVLTATVRCGSTYLREDTPATMTVVAHDPERDPVSFSVRSGPSAPTRFSQTGLNRTTTWGTSANTEVGVVTIIGSGESATIAVNPAANAYGDFSFEVRVCDPHNACSTRTYHSRVQPVNDVPVADDLGPFVAPAVANASVDVTLSGSDPSDTGRPGYPAWGPIARWQITDTPRRIDQPAADGGVVQVDTNPGASLTWGNAAIGTTTDNPTVRYQIPDGWGGTFAFEYSVVDVGHPLPAATSNPATVTVRQAPPPSPPANIVATPNGATLASTTPQAWGIYNYDTAQACPNDLELIPGNATHGTPLGDVPRVKLTWSAASDTRVVGYRVYRDGAAVSGVLASPCFVDSGVAVDGTYDYQVAVVAGNGQEVRSGSVPARTLPSRPDWIFATDVSATAMTLNWPAGPSANRYWVQAYQSVSTNWSCPNADSSTVITDSVLAIFGVPGVTYHYRGEGVQTGTSRWMGGLEPGYMYHMLVASERTGAQPRLSRDFQTSCILTAPATPTLSFNSVTTNSFNVVVGESRSAVNYEIQYSTGIDFPINPWRSIGAPGSTAFTDAAPSTNYYFRVRALNVWTGASEWSPSYGVRTLTPPPPPPPPPAPSGSFRCNLSVSTSAYAVGFNVRTQASWSSCAGAVNYDVEYRITNPLTQATLHDWTRVASNITSRQWGIRVFSPAKMPSSEGVGVGGTGNVCGHMAMDDLFLTYRVRGRKADGSVSNWSNSGARIVCGGNGTIGFNL